MLGGWAHKLVIVFYGMAVISNASSFALSPTASQAGSLGTAASQLCPEVHHGA
jgi:hypothetical protein